MSVFRISNLTRRSAHKRRFIFYRGLPNRARFAFYRGFMGRRLWQGARAAPMQFYYPAALYAGTPSRGEAWLGGDISLAGGVVHVPPPFADSLKPANTKPDNPKPDSQKQEHFFRTATKAAKKNRVGDEWFVALHSFDWLRHLAAARAYDAMAHHLSDWCADDYTSHRLAMRPDVVAMRLMAWSAHLPLLKDALNKDEKLKAIVHQKFAQQAQWLYFTAPLADSGVARLRAAAGLTLTYLVYGERPAHWQRGITLLLRGLKKQILPDGGHISRAPEASAEILNICLAIGAGLVAHNITAPPQLSEAVQRMAAFTRLMCHHDGTLASFQGGLPSTATRIQPLIRTSIMRGKKQSMAYADKSGYQRLAAGKSCLLIDVGAPRPHPRTKPHFAPLAFELSHNKERLIVNCGANRLYGHDWQDAMRQAGAHSGLSFADTPPMPQAIDWQITQRRNEDNRGIWLEASHAAFSRSHGVRHYRRLFMAATGEDIRGEDLLIGGNHQNRRGNSQKSGRKSGRTSIGALFYMRFHLHPGVTTSLLAGGDAALLVARDGHGWHLRVARDSDTPLAMETAEEKIGDKEIEKPTQDIPESIQDNISDSLLQIEESVYMDGEGKPHACRQLSLRAHVQPQDTRIRWALRYVGRHGR